MAVLPHLFISYSEKKQLQDFLLELLINLHHKNSHNEVFYAFAVSGTTFKCLQPACSFQLDEYLYIKGSEVQSGTELLKKLVRELRRRKQLKAGGDTAFAPLIILVEDIFDLVITEKKFTTLYFLELLQAGPANNMHFIAASIRTYQNLVRQVIVSGQHPKIKAMADNRFTMDESLGSELIINPEDLLFYKSKWDKDYRRYFHINEGSHENLSA